jgi:glucose uptake protein GlcU
LIINKHQNLANNNVYVLIESLLLTNFLKRNGAFDKKWSYWLVTGLLLCTWVLEVFVFRSITMNATYFRITASLVILICSVSLLSKVVFSEEKYLHRNALFLLLLSFIIYFTFKALIQAFAIYGFNASMPFLFNLYVIMIYVNLGINLVYALAVLYMPAKTRYLQQS